MSSLLGTTNNGSSSITSKFSALQLSNIQNFAIGGIPVFTYGLIGITTVILATITLYDSEKKEGEEEPTLVSQLPSLTEATETMNPFETKESISEESSEINKPSEPERVGGGKRKKTRMCKRAKHNKTRSKNSK